MLSKSKGVVSVFSGFVVIIKSWFWAGGGAGG